MAGSDGPTHLLSLKVMRVSRPELSNSWQPFFSSSPSLSAHASASILSLQGLEPLTGHPKTLRDLSHATELLTLPSAFGAIQLGETFASCLCLNNETNVVIEDASLKVDVQTATSKVVLAEAGGAGYHLPPSGSLQIVVSHEIKELGQHVLACSVVYRLPLGARAVPGASEDPNDPELQTFRKFYKFMVTNPLSVKTKVHTAKSPSALMSPRERDQVILEVHLQNLTQESLYFELMRFEPMDDWEAQDANVLVVDSEDVGPQEKSIFSGSMTLIQPQDTRQYVYILTPKTPTLFPLTYPPGSVVPLGRLNICWRSSLGEPGRLLTSMLSRRIPLTTAPPPQQASALPSYLKRTIIGNHPSSRPQSPQLSSRPGTPPGPRPTSPPLSKPRHLPTNLIRSQSPVPVPPAPASVPSLDLDTTLIVRHIPRKEIRIEKPFTISLALVISNTGHQRRMVRIAVQHLQHLPHSQSAPHLQLGAAATGTPHSVVHDILSPHIPSSGMSTPSSSAGTFNYAVAHQKLMAISHPSTPRHEPLPLLDTGPDEVTGFPPPIVSSSDDSRSVQQQQPQGNVVYAGSSTLFLPPVMLGSDGADNASQAPTPGAPKTTVVQEFQLTYVPLSKGYSTIGSLRALVVEDRYVSDFESTVAHDGQETPGRSGRAIQTLKEWDVIGEIWVPSSS
ncbi:hypothetical protein AMATHDRAFT_152793 [Amanita thiersii Skay4041]|uniref:DUF974-domain-containing protein n=1 Tax=Amanita thiersii Skay4041 TaxID=703135 RepID=A0A2A9NFY3_9AGAR|nr:hypothetical protein AMATHDRAFT_152793 [Amanita thiersii Skay4041]